MAKKKNRIKTINPVTGENEMESENVNVEELSEEDNLTSEDEKEPEEEEVKEEVVPEPEEEEKEKVVPVEEVKKPTVDELFLKNIKIILKDYEKTAEKIKGVSRPMTKDLEQHVRNLISITSVLFRVKSFKVFDEVLSFIEKHRSGITSDNCIFQGVSSVKIPGFNSASQVKTADILTAFIKLADHNKRKDKSEKFNINIDQLRMSSNNDALVIYFSEKIG
jgi:hypothetical protein